MQEALNMAAKEGYYALPTREFDPRPLNRYDPTTDREDELWAEQLEGFDDIPDCDVEAYDARQAEASACLAQCKAMSRAVSRLATRKALNRKRSKGVGAAARESASSSSSKKRKSDGKGLLGKGKARK
jgi:hypothetical protein